ncbi:MAG: DUF2357 domain-containing protein [Deltaproteobacteria bacterium]|nr:DUF2357 domain-containing protein [Deltaproteobacteria bacterium]
MEVDASALAELRVLRGGEALPLAVRVLDRRPRVVVEWPRSDAGRHRLHIEIGGAASTVEVRVQPRKLPPEAIKALLEDLTLRLPAEIALRLARGGCLAGLRLEPDRPVTVDGEYERLQRAVMGHQGRPGLAKVLREIARDPYRVLTPEHPWRPSERVRRPPPSRLSEAWRRPGNLDAQGLPRQLVDTRPCAEVDVYENRVLRLFADRVAALLRRLRCLAARRSDLAASVEALDSELREARRAARFLDEVAVLAVPPARVTMVLARRRDYRAAYDGLLELRRSAVVELRAADLESPIDNLPGLFQTWGTLRVIAVALKLAAVHKWVVTRQRLALSLAGGAVVELLPDGEPVLTFARDGTVLQFIPERTYSHGGPLRAITYEQRPDIAVERYESDGSVAVWILDPKYKLIGDESSGAGRPVKADIDKMHAYRDAIRDAHDTRVVCFAGVLYPGDTEQWGKGIAALRTHPEDIPALEEALQEVLDPAFL